MALNASNPSNPLGNSPPSLPGSLQSSSLVLSPVRAANEGEVKTNNAAVSLTLTPAAAKDGIELQLSNHKVTDLTKAVNDKISEFSKDTRLLGNHTKDEVIKILKEEVEHADRRKKLVFMLVVAVLVFAAAAAVLFLIPIAALGLAAVPLALVNTTLSGAFLLTAGLTVFSTKDRTILSEQRKKYEALPEKWKLAGPQFQKSIIASLENFEFPNYYNLDGREVNRDDLVFKDIKWKDLKYHEFISVASEWDKAKTPDEKRDLLRSGFKIESNLKETSTEAIFKGMSKEAIAQHGDNLIRYYKTLYSKALQESRDNMITEMVGSPRLMELWEKRTEIETHLEGYRKARNVDPGLEAEARMELETLLYRKEGDFNGKTPEQIKAVANRMLAALERNFYTKEFELLRSGAAGNKLFELEDLLYAYCEGRSSQEKGAARARIEEITGCDPEDEELKGAEPWVVVERVEGYIRENNLEDPSGRPREEEENINSQLTPSTPAGVTQLLITPIQQQDVKQRAADDARLASIGAERPKQDAAQPVNQSEQKGRAEEFASQEQARIARLDESRRREEMKREAILEQQRVDAQERKEQDSNT